MYKGVNLVKMKESPLVKLPHPQKTKKKKKPNLREKSIKQKVIYDRPGGCSLPERCLKKKETP